MEFKNDNEKSLLNNKLSNGSSRICIKWKDFGLKNENEDGDGNYYCYFYTHRRCDKPGMWNLDKSYDPQIKKNDYGALYINYNCHERRKVRFCLVDKKMDEKEAEKATPENKKEVGWYQFSNGDIVEYSEENKSWEPLDISFMVENLNSRQNDDFLMRFNDCSKINITGDKFKQIISTDLGININNIDEDKKNSLKVYVFARSSLSDDPYLLQDPYSLSTGLKNNFETKNCCDGYMEDMISLRFVITNENLDFKVGDQVDMGAIECKIYETNGSIFFLRRDEKNNVVLLHRIKKKSSNEWQLVDAEITLKKQINNSQEWREYKYISKAEVGLIKSFFQNHTGKVIFFGLISVGVGWFWSWLYAPIPIALLVVFAILDYKYKYKFLPGPKKILSCVMPCLSCLKETKRSEMESPRFSSDDKNKNET